MKNQNEGKIVPSQNEGREIVVKASIQLRNQEEAQKLFEKAKERLRNVNGWSTLTGNLSADFQLHDSTGKRVNRYIEEGDLFRIDIPGPGTQAGDGYDWVQIEATEMDSTPARDHYAFRVRPTTNPLKGESDIAHFYSAVSTSTFSVERNKDAVRVAIFDRNIKPNLEAESAIDKLRDTVVGVVGMLGFSRFQWTKLVNGVLAKNENKSNLDKPKG